MQRRKTRRLSPLEPPSSRIYANAPPTTKGLYRNPEAALEHFANIGHLMEPLMATASVTGEVLGTPNAKMKELLAMGGPNLFTPWRSSQD